MQKSSRYTGKWKRQRNAYYMIWDMKYYTDRLYVNICTLYMYKHISSAIYMGFFCKLEKSSFFKVLYFHLLEKTSK